MGDIADMMLEGTLCEGCGEFLGADLGPALCPGCARERREDGYEVENIGGNYITTAEPRKTRTVKPKVACPTCGRMVKMAGLERHWNDMHGAEDE